MDRRDEDHCQSVVASGNASEILQTTECVFDPVPLFVVLLAEPEGPLSIAFVGDDRLRATHFQPRSQGHTIVSFIGQQFLARFGLLDQRFRGRTVMCLAASQQE